MANSLTGLLQAGQNAISGMTQGVSVLPQSLWQSIGGNPLVQNIFNSLGLGNLLPTEATTTVQNADGSRTVIKSDGTQTTLHADGSKTVIQADGTETITAANGTLTTIALDGTKSVLFPNLSEAKYDVSGTLVFYQAADGTTETFDPTTGIRTTLYTDGSKTVIQANGTETTTEASGTVTTIAPDGTKSVLYPDFSEKKYDANGSLVFYQAADGTTETIDPTTGIRTTLYTDGTKSTVGANGVVTTFSPDGSEFVLNPDFSEAQYDAKGNLVYYRAPNGTTETFDPHTGMRTTIYPDKTEATSAPNGMVTTLMPDGTKIVRNPDTTETKYDLDGTIETFNPATGIRAKLSPNGTTTTITPNGVVTIIALNGTKSVLNPDMSEAKYNANGKLIYYRAANGTVETIDPQTNTRTTFYTDGSAISVQPDGTQVITKADGITTFLTPQGKPKMVISADGRQITTYRSDGTTDTLNSVTNIETIVYPDNTIDTIDQITGIQTTSHPDGSQTITLKDGTVTQTSVHGFKSVTDPSGKIAITNADGTATIQVQNGVSTITDAQGHVTTAPYYPGSMPTDPEKAFLFNKILALNGDDFSKNQNTLSSLSSLSPAQLQEVLELFSKTSGKFGCPRRCYGS